MHGLESRVYEFLALSHGGVARLRRWRVLRTPPLPITIVATALRELNTKHGPRYLLSHVRGLDLKEMDAAEECCGFGGTFSVKFPGVSGGMARTKIDSILRNRAPTR